MSTPVFIIIGVALLLMTLIIFIYSRLSSIKAKAAEAWSRVKNQLKNRRELIERLEALLKQNGNSDLQLIQNLTRARYDSEVALTLLDQIKAEDVLTENLNKVITQVPSSQTDDPSFVKLRAALAQSESNIAQISKHYNSVIEVHNKRVTVFPSSFFASALKMNILDYFGE